MKTRGKGRRKGNLSKLGVRRLVAFFLGALTLGLVILGLFDVQPQRSLVMLSLLPLVIFSVSAGVVFSAARQRRWAPTASAALLLSLTGIVLIGVDAFGTGAMGAAYLWSALIGLPVSFLFFGYALAPRKKKAAKGVAAESARGQRRGPEQTEAAREQPPGGMENAA